MKKFCFHFLFANKIKLYHLQSQLVISGIFRSSTFKDKHKKWHLDKAAKGEVLIPSWLGAPKKKLCSFVPARSPWKEHGVRCTKKQKIHRSSFLLEVKFLWFMLYGVSCSHTDNFGCFRNFISHQCVTMTISIWRIEVNDDLPTKGKSLK